MLATPQAFVRDPSLVWEFYHWRREVVSRCRWGHVRLLADGLTTHAGQCEDSE
jgi:NAD-dependent SIR2 family protein deacetylase